MVGQFKCYLVTTAQRQGKDGNTYSSITVMQDDDVVKMPCANEVLSRFTGKQFKPVTILVTLSEYSGEKSYRCIGLLDDTANK